MKPKLLRITTVPVSLHKLLHGQANYMQQKGFDVILASAQGKEIEQIEKETGLQVNILPLTRKMAPLTDLKALIKTYEFIKKHQPLIVHTHTPKAGIVGMLASKFAGVPIRMHTVAGIPLLETKGIKRKILNMVEKLTYRSATHVYPNSYGLREIILENKLAKSNKLKVIANGSSNGIDTGHFNPEFFSTKQKETLKKDLGIESKDFVFVFVGRLVGDKGINELINAFAFLNKRFANMKLLLVGNEEPVLDPLQSGTQKIIKENNKIVTTGWVEDVRPFLSIADVLVFPSYREGFPNVVMQAGAMDLPAVVTDINGCNEIITDGFNGLIIQPKNTIQLQETMEVLYTNDELRNSLAQNARHNIISKYEQKMVWETLLEEYNRLLMSLRTQRP